MKHSLLLFGAFLFSVSAASAAAPITVAPPTGSDIATAVADAKAGQEVGTITIDLAEGGSYTLSASIETGDGLVINGNGATIDASALEAPFILMAATPAVEVVNDYYRVDAITVNNVTVSGLKNSIFYDNNTKYCIVNFTLDGVNFALPTEAVQNEALVSFKGGGAKDFTVKNSTIYGNGEVAKYFIRYNNNARLDRYGFDKETEFQTMTYLNNTFYNLLKDGSQWGNYNGIQGMVYSKFDVQKNIWVNCGNEIIRRMAGGRFNDNAPVNFAYNTFFENGVNGVASEAGYDKSGTILTTNPAFANVAEANFTIGAGTQQAEFSTGDPKWDVEYNAALAAPVVPVTIAPEAGADVDLAAAINNAKYAVMVEGNIPGSITVTLAENGEYKIGSSIETAASLAIAGNGATLDASNLATPFILMSKMPAVAVESDYYRVDSVKVENLTVNGAKNSIFYDNDTKYCVVDFSLDKVNFDLATTTVQNEAIISFKAGGAKDFTIKNSTVNGNGEVAKYFIRYNNGVKLEKLGFDKETEFLTMNYQNNTFYNLLKEGGQWGNYSGVAGQKSHKFDVQKNIWVNCGNEIIRRMVGGRIADNQTVTFAYNTYFEEGSNLLMSEKGYDKSGTILYTNPAFAGAEAADFTIGAGTEQAVFQTGAPKWFAEYDSALAPATTPITVAPDANAELSAAVIAALDAVIEAGNIPGDITVNLAENANYTVAGSIEAPATITINGNGSTVDASGLEAPFILMSKLPTAPMISSYFRVDSIKMNDLALNGAKNSIFYDNDVKYCVVDFALDKVSMDLATGAVQNEALVSFKAGGAKDFTVKNSTIYGNGEVAKYFIRYNNSARLDRFGFNKDTEFQTMTYLNNTFYNLLKADGQWGNYSAIAGQNYIKFDVQKNIWVDCGKDIIRRMCGGRFGNNAPLTFAYNTYFEDGENLVASEVSYDKSGLILATNPGFVNAAEANFTIGAGTQQAQFATGDPKWDVAYDATLAAPAVPVTAAPEAGSEIAAAVNNAKYAVMTAGNVPGDVTVTLAENGEYTLTSSIETGASLTIEGNGATVSATGLEAPFILMSKLPAVALENDYYRVDSVKVNSLTLNGAKNSIFYDNDTKYCVVDFALDEVSMDLATAAVQNEALVSFKAGGAKDFTVKNSTIYGNGEVAKYFIRYNNNSRLDRYGFDKDTEFQTMTYLNNTFYNLLKEDGQWGNYNGIQGQNYSKFDVQKNIWVNCGKEIIRRLSGGRFGGNAPLTFAYNTYFEDGVNIGADEAKFDNSKTILTTNPGFANADEGNFTIGAGTQQAEFQTGAPKWLVDYDAALAAPAVPVTVAPETGTEIAAAVNAAKAAVVAEGHIPGDITINLAENGEYTLASSIETGAGLVINGNNATVDAASLAAPFILMSSMPAVALESDYYRVGAINVNNVNVDSIKNSIFYDNNVKYCVVDYTLNNVDFALATEAVQNDALISFKAGGAKDVTIKNSTIWGNGEVAKYFIRFNNSARLDRYGFDKDTEFQVMTYLSNTFYNLLTEEGQWGNYSALQGQNYIKFDIEKNIWFNCGNDIMRRLAGGRFGGNAPCTFAYNTYFENDECTAESEASYDKSETILTTNPGFANAAEGDFTIGATTQQAEFQTGAPKWLVPYEKEDSLDAIDADENAPVEYYNLQGIRVETPAAGNIYIRRQGSKVTKILIQ